MIRRTLGPRAFPLQTARGRTFSRPQLETLEDRCLLAAPVIDPINNVGVLVGSSRLLPLTASDTDNDTLRYSLSSDSPGVTAELHVGNPSLEPAVSYTPRGATIPTTGKLVFQLLQDIAPNTVATIRRLVEQGFYNNLTFHRLAFNNATRPPSPIAIFAGDPNGDGTDGPGYTFDDEFRPAAVFSGDGQLAMATSGKDTNGSQFFVTIGEQPQFNFNHTIFGQLVRGFDVRDQIVEIDRGSGTERPASPVTIMNARVFENKTDAVLTLRATEPGAANITVTATDGTPEGTVTQSFEVFGSVPFDAPLNDPPILGPVVNQTAAANTPIAFSLTATDLENDAVEFKAQVLDAPARATVVVNGSQVTVTPARDFAGTINLLVGVKQVGATSRGSVSDPFDTQRIAVTVNAGQPTPAA